MNASAVRVGTDVEPIDAVAEAIRRLGRRYLDEVYTAHEIAASGGPTEASAAGLAARFAAKEATLKILRIADYDPHSVEVCREDGGWCRLRLTGSAAATAERFGLHSFDVSLSHGGGVAMATVVAMIEEG